MDPDNYPTTITVEALRRYKTPERFAKEFPEAICDYHYDLPLDRFCVNGGGGSDVEDETIEVATFTRAEVTGMYSFCFVESYYGGCRDFDLHDRVKANLNFRFDRKTGELRLWGGTAKRGYEREEF